MAFIIDNRLQKCKDNLGGASELYIFEWEKYTRTQIEISENILKQFPSNIVYNINALQIEFTESVEHEDGGVSYSQSGSFQLNKIQKWDNYKFLCEKDWRVIIKDNNGNYRLLGLENGLVFKFTKEIGNTFNSFNGFKMTFENKEENSAPFFYDFSEFFEVYVNPLSLEVELENEI